MNFFIHIFEIFSKSTRMQNPNPLGPGISLLPHKSNPEGLRCTVETSDDSEREKPADDAKNYEIKIAFRISSNRDTYPLT